VTVDPLRSFAGVMAATLLLEMIVVLLSIPVVSKLGSGMATWQGVLVVALAVALLLTCAVLRRPWGIWAAVGVQIVMIVCWVAVPALGILGLVFGLVWAILLWMRRDVAKRMAEGRLPSQQSTESTKPAASTED
jgi:nicotinamide riboside transporter PnuC